MTMHTVIFTLDDFSAAMLNLTPHLRKFALSLTRSGPDADDLVQDAYTKALSNWQQYDPKQPFDRWMFRVLRNLWVSEIRKRKVRFGKGHVPAEEATELTIEYAPETIFAAAQMRQKLADLCPKLRTPLLLVCEEGYSHRETADILGIPIGTVLSRVHRARKELTSACA